MPTFREDLHLGHKVPLIEVDDLADGEIVSVKLADKCITTNKLDDKAVTEEKIADGAVTTPKIADGAVTFDKLSPNIQKQLTEMAKRYVTYIEQSLGGFMQPGETETITVKVVNGLGVDVTKDFPFILVKRDSGDSASDDVWNMEHTSLDNPFEISFSDLGIDGITRKIVVFSVIAYGEEDAISAIAEYSL